jgi:hypothetical protein
MPRVACLILTITFSARFIVERKNNSALAILIAAIFVVSPPSGITLTLASLRSVQGDWRAWLEEGVRVQTSLYARGLIVFTMCVVYISTAIRKLNHVFLGGTSVYAVLRFLQDERHCRHYPDGWYPRWFLERFVNDEERRLVRRWRPIMWTTVCLELVLPLALLTPPIAYLAVVAGIILHAAFALLSPFAITHFSLFSVATYLLFLDDAHFTAVIERWIR